MGGVTEKQNQSQRLNKQKINQQAFYHYHYHLNGHLNGSK
jgi:hypothetical protein